VRVAEHWLIRELRKFILLAKDPLAWIMTLALLSGVGLMLWFLFTAANNFGAYYSVRYACSAEFSQIRVFFLTILAPLFFVAVFVTVAELTVVLGLRRKKRGMVSYRFLLIALSAMIGLGLISFWLLRC
jgi:hypothetical protein